MFRVPSTVCYGPHLPKPRDLHSQTCFGTGPSRLTSDYSVEAMTTTCLKTSIGCYPGKVPAVKPTWRPAITLKDGFGRSFVPRGGRLRRPHLCTHDSNLSHRAIRYRSQGGVPGDDGSGAARHRGFQHWKQNCFCSRAVAMTTRSTRSAKPSPIPADTIPR